MSASKPPKVSGPSGEHPAVIGMHEQLERLRADEERARRIRERLERLSQRPPAPPPSEPDPQSKE